MFGEAGVAQIEHYITEEPALTTAYAWFHWTLVAYPPFLAQDLIRMSALRNGAIMQVKLHLKPAPLR